MSAVNSFKVIACFSIIPLGKKIINLGSYVATAIKAINKVKDVRCEIIPMGNSYRSKEPR